MLTNGIKKCIECGRYNGRYNPDSILNSTRCSECKSESQLTNLKLVQAKNGDRAVAWTACGTVWCVGAIVKNIDIKGIDPMFIKSIIKIESEKSEVTSGKGA